LTTKFHFPLSYPQAGLPFLALFATIYIEIKRQPEETSREVSFICAKMKNVDL
jgi:hypothetical protein